MSAIGWKVLSICLLARMLHGRRNVLVGTNAPGPSAAALLARALSGGATQLTIIGSRRHSAFADDMAEGFDRAVSGRFDGYFATAGQIDGQANLNMVGLGTHPRLDVRWSGSHGVPLFYMMIPNTILMKEEHTKSVLVPHVDFISAPGISPPEVHRPGGPIALLTSRCLFAFDREAGCFRLESLHPGRSLDEVLDNTGFAFEYGDSVPETEAPEPTMLESLREIVLPELRLMFPQYAKGLEEEVGFVLS
jgi:glutaconate CoA-transferase, subunit B